jgi:hypothetical protein
MFGLVPGSRLVGSDLPAWHRSWTDYGVPGSNTVSPDGEAFSRFSTEGLSISPTSGLCFERLLKVLGINPALARCAHVIFSPFSP